MSKKGMNSTAWHGRTRIEDSSLPTLLDSRPVACCGFIGGDRPLFTYWRTSDGAVMVATSFAGLVKGFSAQGRRYPSLEDAAQAVRAAREIVAARWARQGWPTTTVN